MLITARPRPTPPPSFFPAQVYLNIWHTIYQSGRGAPPTICYPVVFLERSVLFQYQPLLSANSGCEELSLSGWTKRSKCYSLTIRCMVRQAPILLRRYNSSYHSQTTTLTRNTIISTAVFSTALHWFPPLGKNYATTLYKK